MAAIRWFITAEAVNAASAAPDAVRNFANVIARQTLAEDRLQPFIRFRAAVWREAGRALEANLTVRETLGQRALVIDIFFYLWGEHDATSVIVNFYFDGDAPGPAPDNSLPSSLLPLPSG